METQGFFGKRNENDNENDLSEDKKRRQGKGVGWTMLSILSIILKAEGQERRHGEVQDPPCRFIARKRKVRKHIVIGVIVVCKRHGMTKVRTVWNKDCSIDEKEDNDDDSSQQHVEGDIDVRWKKLNTDDYVLKVDHGHIYVANWKLKDTTYKQRW